MSGPKAEADIPLNRLESLEPAQSELGSG